MCVTHTKAAFIIRYFHVTVVETHTIEKVKKTLPHCQVSLEKCIAATNLAFWMPGGGQIWPWQAASCDLWLVQTALFMLEHWVEPIIFNCLENTTMPSESAQLRQISTTILLYVVRPLVRKPWLSFSFAQAKNCHVSAKWLHRHVMSSLSLSYLLSAFLLHCRTLSPT